MNAIHSLKNQYLGINAHLHSYWQAEGGWSSFHTTHIATLTSALKSHLLPMGYTADIEQSLQIRRLDDRAGRPTADVSIYDLLAGRTLRPIRMDKGATTALRLPIMTLLEENPLSEIHYRAIAIYQAGGGKRDKPVAWLELLSPSNKGTGEDAENYVQKRNDILDNGIVFVEIDYLHETRPTIRRLPNYSAANGHAQQAHPYRIIVLDPRPQLATGQADLYEFDVDTPIPVVAMPLNAGDVLAFDFDAPYQKTFVELFYGLELVDYGQLPLNFRRYRERDQARIATRMLAVIEAANQQVELEQGPFPVHDMPLKKALAQLQAVGVT